MGSLNINLSDDAKQKLKQLLMEHSEYDCININFIPRCVGTKNIELTLDNIKSNYEIYPIDDTLFFIYKENLQNIIESIDIIFKNSEFKIKVKSTNKNNSCNKKSSCSGGCGRCKTCSHNHICKKPSES